MINEYFEISIYNIPIDNINNLAKILGLNSIKIIDSNIYDSIREEEIKFEQIDDLNDFLQKSPNVITLKISSLYMGITF